MKAECSQASPRLSVADMVQLIKDAPPGPWATAGEFKNGKWVDDPVRTWAHWNNTKEAMRVLAQEFIDSRLPKEWGAAPSYPVPRGIVIAGGSAPVSRAGLPHGYFPCIWLLVNKLKLMNCSLPIQVWHLGEKELDPASRRLLTGLGVECVDALEVAKTWPVRILCGWELKPFAALHCPFQEVLLIDADNAPINFPVEGLFDQSRYRELGACFWPDFAQWELDKGVFDVFGIPYRKEVAFESGQFLVNKGRCWPELRLALWYAEHSDFVFKHVYGDKECFHLAWRKLGLDYAMPKRNPGWAGNCCIVQHDEADRRVFLHRCQDKWKLNGGNKSIEGLEDEELHHSIVKQLRAVWSGQSWRNTAPNVLERATIDELEYSQFSYERMPIGPFKGDKRILSLGSGQDGNVSEGAAGREKTWSVSHDGKRASLHLIGEDGLLTCTLRQSSPGVWEGAWVDYEKCPVRLTSTGVKCLTPEKKPPVDEVEKVLALLIALGYNIAGSLKEKTEDFLRSLNGDREPSEGGGKFFERYAGPGGVGASIEGVGAVG